MNTLIFLLVVFGSSSARDLLSWRNLLPNHFLVSDLIGWSVTDFNYIINGHESPPNSKPYQAGLIIDGSYLCGGSLISRNYVLTAAHCLKGFSEARVILGAHNIRKRELTQYAVDTTTFIIHPDYNPKNLNYDVGLLKLPESVPLNKYIQVIPLASTETVEGTKATASGWGDLSDKSGNANGTLFEVDLDVISNEDCRKNYGADIIKHFTICTSGLGIEGICRGDSGGPLVVDNVLIGINSFVSNAGCESGHPSGYVRISAIKNWIIENSDLKEQKLVM